MLLTIFLLTSFPTIHGNNKLHGEANFGRHYGGNWYGNSKPSVGGGINFVSRF